MSLKNYKKKILIYAHYYIPDVASTGQICADLAEGLSDVFDVTVICVVPSYTGKVDVYYKKRKQKMFFEELNGVHLVRIYVHDFNKRSKFSRASNIFSYFWGAIKATKALGQFDFVFSISQPPILGGLLGVYGAKKKRAKLIYNIQDFNPEQIIAVNYNHNKLLLNVLMKVDKRSCIKSDLLITVGRDLVETVNKRFEKSKRKPQKIIMINNWVNENKLYPISNENSGVLQFKKNHGLEGKFIFMYSGNLGLYYDLENILLSLIDFPKDLKTPDGKEVVFVFVGSGSVESKLKAIKDKFNLVNVFFISYQLQDQILYSLNSADVHFCFSAAGIKGVSCPSKFYGIVACAKPVIAVLDPESEIGMLVAESKSGYISSPGDYKTFIDNVKDAVKHPQKLEMMGKSGFQYFQGHLSSKISINSYKESILELGNKNE